MTEDPRAAISFHNLTLGYDRHPAVHHITGDVARGELLALVGPNGAGKSTLLKGIVGQIKPLSGSLSLDGLKLREIAYLPQQIDIDRSFPITVFDAVAMGLWQEIDTPEPVPCSAPSARSGCKTSPTAASARSPEGSSSASCSRACSCKTRPSSCSMSRSAPSTPRPSTISFASSAVGTRKGGP
jgi:energy-coupling factor transporter ATP-binding protein EcfA2